jgi:predicted HTH domain antitoxin
LLKEALKMKTIQLQVPDDLDLKEYDFSMIIASKLFEEGKLSSGQAAEMVGLSKGAFLEVIGKYGVSVFSSSLTDLYSDISNA